jgi:hypothetical protein
MMIPLLEKYSFHREDKSFDRGKKCFQPEKKSFQAGNRETPVWRKIFSTSIWRIR